MFSGAVSGWRSCCRAAVNDRTDEKGCRLAAFFISITDRGVFFPRRRACPKGEPPHHWTEDRKTVLRLLAVENAQQMPMVFCMFRLLLRCQECGRTWHSSPVHFSKAGTKPETEGMRAVFRTLYEREREAAREKAAAEALEIFSQCPVCGRLVCNRCFLICEDLDLCAACAKALQVRGDIVAGETSSPREFPAESAGRISTEEDKTT